MYTNNKRMREFNSQSIYLFMIKIMFNLCIMHNFYSIYRIIYFLEFIYLFIINIMKNEFNLIIINNKLI